MTHNDRLMEQCLREAEAKYPYPSKDIPDPCMVGRYLMERAFVDQLREVCVQTLYAERSKPRLTVEEVITELREAWLEVRHCGEDENGDYEWVDPDELETELEDRLTEKLNQTNG